MQSIGAARLHRVLREFFQQDLEGGGEAERVGCAREGESGRSVPSLCAVSGGLAAGRPGI
eukprot:752684-Hanusia_phi.AAC.2